MTTLASFYTSAAQAPIQHRRYALGAAYFLQERVAWGESITSARNRVMSLPQYSTALAAAGLDDDLAAVDFVPGGPQLSYVQEVTADSPTRWYRLNESSGTVADDAVGTADGTIGAGVTFAAPGALADNFALGFDGAQSRVSLPSAAWTTGDFTIEALAYITGAGSVGTTDYSCVLGYDGSHRLMLRNSTGEVLAQMGAGNVTAPAGTIQINHWVHFVYVKSGSVQTVYINGAAVGTLTQAGAQFASAYFLGAYGNPSLNYSFKGRIDEHALYRAALDPARIQAHYQAFLAGQAAVPEGINPTTVTATHAPSPLTITTPDGSGQVVEPCVERIPGGWNGHEWWALITGYTNSNVATENPAIYYSDDGVNFTPVPGAAFPLVPKPATGNNADPELRLGPDGKLHGFYITVDNPVGNASVWHISSSDGVSWSTPAAILSATKTVEQFTGPVVLWDPDNNQWVMWYVDAHNTAATYPIKRRTCTGTDPGGTWSSATTCTVNGLPAGRSPWEKHVERAGAQLHMVCTLVDNGSGGGDATLHFATSDDQGATWTFNPNPMLSAGTSGQWDDFTVYRGDFSANDPDGGFYGLWYSGRNTAGVWRWGKTSMSRT